MYKGNCASLETLCDHSHTASKYFWSLIAIQNMLSQWFTIISLLKCGMLPTILILWAGSCSQLYPE